MNTRQAIPVYKYKRGQLLAEYPSIFKAAAANGLSEDTLRRWLRGESKHAPAYYTEGITYSFEKIDYKFSLESYKKTAEGFKEMFVKAVDHSGHLFQRVLELDKENQFLRNRTLWERIINKQYNGGDNQEA